MMLMYKNTLRGKQLLSRSPLCIPPVSTAKTCHFLLYRAVYRTLSHNNNYMFFYANPWWFVSMQICRNSPHEDCRKK